MNLESLIQYGALGVVCAACLVQLFSLWNKTLKQLLTVVSENAAAQVKSAAALEKLADTIERCQLSHNSRD